MRELIRLVSEKRSRHRSCLKSLGSNVRSYDGMRIPAWRPQPTNSRHGLPYQSADRRPTAVHRALASNEPKWPKTGVQPAEDPHYFALAIPESHRAGPCGLGGAPYGRRQSRRTDGARGRYPRRGKGVKPSGGADFGGPLRGAGTLPYRDPTLTGGGPERSQAPGRRLLELLEAAYAL